MYRNATDFVSIEHLFSLTIFEYTQALLRINSYTTKHSVVSKLVYFLCNFPGGAAVAVFAFVLVVPEEKNRISGQVQSSVSMILPSVSADGDAV